MEPRETTVCVLTKTLFQTQQKVWEGRGEDKPVATWHFQENTSFSLTEEVGRAVGEGVRVLGGREGRGGGEGEKRRDSWGKPCHLAKRQCQKWATACADYGVLISAARVTPEERRESEGTAVGWSCGWLVIAQRVPPVLSCRAGAAVCWLSPFPSSLLVFNFKPRATFCSRTHAHTHTHTHKLGLLTRTDSNTLPFFFFSTPLLCYP